MATTLTLTKATPHSLSYQMVGDGVLGSISGAQLIADCVPGPLRTQLQRVNALTLTRFNLNNPSTLLDSMGRVRIRSVDGIAGVQTPPVTKTIEWTASALAVTASAGSTCQLEIRLTHSRDR